MEECNYQNMSWEGNMIIQQVLVVCQGLLFGTGGGEAN